MVSSINTVGSTNLNSELVSRYSTDKPYVAFYAKGGSVKVFRSTTNPFSPIAPLFDGVVINQHVSFYVRRHAAGTCSLSLLSDRDAYGLRAELGTARVSTGADGCPTLSISLFGHPKAICASITKDVPQELLHLLGLQRECVPA